MGVLREYVRKNKKDVEKYKRPKKANKKSRDEYSEG
jgi:hypothetical protein